MQPEAHWIVELGADLISVRDQAGGVRTVLKAELSGVVIETNDTGPWGADVWWLLFGADDRLACLFPQGATGEQAAVDYLLSLEGVDHERVVTAMSSTNNAVFPVWRKSL